MTFHLWYLIKSLDYCLPSPCFIYGALYGALPALRQAIYLHTLQLLTHTPVMLSIWLPDNSVKLEQKLSMYSLDKLFIICIMFHVFSLNRFIGPTDKVQLGQSAGQCSSLCQFIYLCWEFSGYFMEKAWKEWPKILHADVPWTIFRTYCIVFWLQSEDFFSNLGAI